MDAEWWWGIRHKSIVKSFWTRLEVVSETIRGALRQLLKVSLIKLQDSKINIRCS
jgi:hypothetical protein